MEIWIVPIKNKLNYYKMPINDFYEGNSFINIQISFILLLLQYCWLY